MATEATDPLAMLESETHDTSWSADLEHGPFTDDHDIVIEAAVVAVHRTEPGNHVNLVTAGELGHPETYLYDALADEPDVESWEFVDRCGCGGYVTRVQVV